MRNYVLTAVAFTVIIFLFFPATSFAHCDGMDGPVVLAAKQALNTGDINLILIWIQKDDEPELRQVFDHTLKVRELGEDAQKLADTFFFETLVRVHRAGEGAPYTGLKPAGRDLGPAIPAADKSIETGNVKQVLELLNEEIRNGIYHHFVKVQNLKDYDKNNIKAGRDFIKAYVEFLHYVEPIYELATRESVHGKSTYEEKLHH
jgi:Family of unknown function (DUF6448)